MNKGCYLAFEFPLIKESEYKETESGIKKKIFWQFETFRDYGYTMNFSNPYENKNIIKRKIRRRLPFFYFTKWDEEFIFNKEIDFFYIRKPWHMDGDLIKYLKRIKINNPKCKILLEVPTFPYDAEHHTLSMKPLVYKDRFWRKYLKHYVDRIITYSDDTTIFGIPTIQISNAMDMNGVKPANIKPFNPKCIHVMMCATLCYWHGYDRAIQGIYEYYKNGGKTNYILHIVGDGEETDHFQRLINEYSLEEHIIMHGKQYGEDLDEIYALCDIGFDSMGRHRSGVTYNSSLKGKEYAAKGLPIVSGVCTELDYDKDYPYYYRVPADDSPVSFFEIDEFCNHIYADKDITTIRKEIRSYSEQNFSYKATFKKVIDYIEDND